MQFISIFALYVPTRYAVLKLICSIEIICTLTIQYKMDFCI